MSSTCNLCRHNCLPPSPRGHCNVSHVQRWTRTGNCTQFAGVPGHRWILPPRRLREKWAAELAAAEAPGD